MTSDGGLRWPAVALIAGLPLVVDPGGHHRYTAMRFVFAAAVVTAGLVTVILRRRDPLPARLTTTWVAALGVTAAATAFALDPALGLLGDPVRLMGLITAAITFGAFLLGAATGTSGARRAGDALLAGSVVVVVVGLGEWVGVGGHVGRPTSTLGNAGFLGAYLCLVIPIAASRLLGDRRAPVWSGPLLVALVLLLVASGSRGAWVGAAVGLGALAMLRGYRIAAAAAVVVVLAVLVAAPFASRDTARGRVDTWAEALPVIAARPVLGWGPDGFRTGFARHVSAGWVRRYSLDQIPDRAHNRFLDIAGATGLAGVLADVALIAGVAQLARRATRAVSDDNPQQLWTVAGIAAALVGWLAQGQFLFDTFDLAMVAWVLAGALAATAAPALATRRRRWPIVALMVASAATMAIAVRGVVADRLVMAASGRPASVAVDRLVHAAHLRPRSLDIYLLAAEVAVRSGDADVLQQAHGLLQGWHDDAVRAADARIRASLRLACAGAKPVHGCRKQVGE